MNTYKTLKTNLQHAVRNRTCVYAGGGEFTPAEIKQFLATLERMEASLAECEPGIESNTFGPAYAMAVQRHEDILKEIK